MSEAARAECVRCGTHLGMGMLACPKCGKLVHSETLNQLAGEAGAAEAAGDRMKAVLLWRRALTLLPPGAGQRAKIEERVERLEQPTASPDEDKQAIEKKSKAWAKWLGILAPAAAFLATKGKFLILGLTKLPTLLSMFLFLSVYWQTWGWAFALGFVLCIYVHEMGHVVVLRHYGIGATAPLFIPGFGAVIFAKQRIQSPVEDARVGLAGPVAGLMAALFCFAVYSITESKLFLALTVFGAFINLFNLVPILFLDGSRGFRGLGTQQRWVVIGLGVLCYFVFDSGLSMGVAVVMAGRQILWRSKEAASQPDGLSFALFAMLIVSLAGLSALDAPTPEELGHPRVTASR